MITLIFGAGASYGSGRTIPYNPPLGNYLFDNLVSLNRAFAALPQDIKDVFIERGFEEGMAYIANDSRKINPLQKEIACYLSKFKITPENAYTRLFNKLRRYMSEINIVTLNYDTLIEQALGLTGYPSDYNFSGQGVNVLKPHGSSNFLPRIPNGCSFSGNTMIGCGTFFEGLQTYAVSTHEEVVSWCGDPRNSDLSPVLSLYEKGKRVVINSALINKVKEDYKGVISTSDLIVLVGIKYIEHDSHIWQPLEESHADLLVVDPYPQDTNEWLNRTKKDSAEVLCNGFEDSVLAIARTVKRYVI
ncbi:hypothetical protein [Aeromonas salmonicida]|uniref:hypothetical protein n=1 Tax=Aeromonas salmonicida TaxID=645 RepID=UPI000DE5BCF8|nr:hypothetical protein [Aeromonas salmonicida]